MACTQINDRRAETKAVKGALKLAGITAKVGHGTGTAWGWLEINVGDQRENFGEHDGREGRGDCTANCPACNLYRALRDETIRIAQEATGRGGDYNGDISVSMNDEIDQSEWIARQTETATCDTCDKPVDSDGINCTCGTYCAECGEYACQDCDLTSDEAGDCPRKATEPTATVLPMREDSATDAYREREAKAIKALDAIRAAIKSESEGRKHWGHVGSMGHVMMELEQLAATLGCDGYELD